MDDEPLQQATGTQATATIRKKRVVLFRRFVVGHSRVFMYQK
jgi:hypothetical protein